VKVVYGGNTWMSLLAAVCIVILLSCYLTAVVVANFNRTVQYNSTVVSTFFMASGSAKKSKEYKKT